MNAHPANAKLSLSQSGAHLIKHFESCLKSVGNGMYAAYRDPGGVPTIGWGHTNARGLRLFKMGDRWTRWRCDEVFGLDMEYFERHVRRLVKVKLTQKQFDALMSFTFNLGAGSLGRSTLLKRVNASDFNGAASEFTRWNKQGGRVLRGLTRRRTSEANVFRGKSDQHYKAAA